jgi:SAM-dependent methyltransferase
MNPHQLPKCRSCSATELVSILNLGSTPLANALLTEPELTEPEETYPLELVFCSACALVQITETVSPEKLFRDYFYRSSFSDTMLRHAEALVLELISARGLGQTSLAMEVASNDGYLLQYYRQKNIPVLGIEPAANIARVAREERGVPTISEFFDADLARKLAEENQLADVIHANNVLAHVSDLNGFVRGLKLLLKPGGVAVIEVPYVKDMIDRTEFDTIYHEHLCYFSLTALDRLFRRHDMLICDVERLPIHGGSLRVFATHSGSPQKPAVLQLRQEEAAWGVASQDFYRGFAGQVEALKARVKEFIAGLKKENQRLAAYGAAAKGSTLLNYLRLGKESIDFVVDRNTYKQGYYMPGVHLPIHPPARLLEEMPSHVLLLTWNFADEIIEQQAEYRRRGGRFIIPIPKLRIV